MKLNRIKTKSNQITEKSNQNATNELGTQFILRSLLAARYLRKQNTMIMYMDTILATLISDGMLPVNSQCGLISTDFLQFPNQIQSRKNRALN